MATRGLLEADCGGQNPLSQLRSHYTKVIVNFFNVRGTHNILDKVDFNRWSRKHLLFLGISTIGMLVALSCIGLAQY